MIKKELNPEQGKRLKECLEDAGMTQKELAEKSGYTKQYISNIVVGKKNMSHESASIFAKILHVEIGYLLCESKFKTHEDLMDDAWEFGGFKNYIGVGLLELFDIIYTSMIVESNKEGEIITDDLEPALIFDKEFLLHRKVDIDGVSIIISDIKACVNINNSQKYIPYEMIHQLYKDIFDYAEFKCDKFKKDFSSL